MTDTLLIEREDFVLAAFHDKLDSGFSVEAALAHSVRQFPEFAEFLTDAATINAAGVLNADSPAASDEATRVALHRVKETFRPMPISGILNSLKTTGQDVSSILVRLRIDKTILRKLDQRLIELATVPQELLRQLADVLYEPLDRIAEYLALPPELPKGFRAKGRVPPQAKKETFANALRTSFDLKLPEFNQADYDYWRSPLRDGDQSEG